MNKEGYTGHGALKSVTTRTFWLHKTQQFVKKHITSSFNILFLSNTWIVSQLSSCPLTSGKMPLPIIAWNLSYLYCKEDLMFTIQNGDGLPMKGPQAPLTTFNDTHVTLKHASHQRTQSATNFIPVLNMTNSLQNRKRANIRSLTGVITHLRTSSTNQKRNSASTLLPMCNNIGIQQLLSAI